MPVWPKRKERPGIDEYGRTQLWNCCFTGDIEEVVKILKSDIDPNIGDDKGITPLHIAIQEWHIEIIELLLANGADINLADINGNIPLWTALHNWRKKIDVILLLLKAGADPRIENNYGNSPMSVFNNTDNDEIKAIIRKKYWEEPNT